LQQLGGRLVAGPPKSDAGRRVIALDKITIAALREHRARKQAERGAAGVDLKVVQDQLGHSTVVLTADTYTSVLPETARTAAEHTAALLSSAASSTKTSGPHRSQGQDRWPSSGIPQGRLDADGPDPQTMATTGARDASLPGGAASPPHTQGRSPVR
jgi:hypothetical protein